MMKRVGVIMLALLYTITAAGFALNLHYCGNTVAAVKINAPAKGCARPMAKTKMKCCKDTKLEVKVKDDHQGQPVSFLAKIFAVQLPKQIFANLFLSPQHAMLNRFADRGPPPDVVLADTPVFLKNCIIRI